MEVSQEYRNEEDFLRMAEDEVVHTGLQIGTGNQHHGRWEKERSREPLSSPPMIANGGQRPATSQGLAESQRLTLAESIESHLREAPPVQYSRAFLFRNNAAVGRLGGAQLEVNPPVQREGDRKSNGRLQWSRPRTPSATRRRMLQHVP